MQRIFSFIKVGLIYEYTFNKEGVYSQLQRAILFDLPSETNLRQFNPIKILLAPPGYKEVIYHEGASKESYFEKGFVEISIRFTPEKMKNLSYYVHGNCKQYRLRHNISGTIHLAIGDTLSSVATSISIHNPSYKLQNKGQLMVIISRTPIYFDTIFVGDKEDTLDALVYLLKYCTQWIDYMEALLCIVTINDNDSDFHEERNNNPVMDQSTFPFLITDFTVPEDSSGYVYILISTKCYSYTYICKTTNMFAHLRTHNSGYGSKSSEPPHL